MGVTLSRSPHTPPALLRRSAGVVRSPIVASDLVFSTNIYPSSGRLDGRSEMRYRSEDWLMNLLSLPRSLVLRRVSSHLAASLLSCAAVLAGRSAGLPLQLPPLPHTLLGSFLGLLLVFRTNSAYGYAPPGRARLRPFAPGPARPARSRPRCTRPRGASGGRRAAASGRLE